jgi:hypothetical protein
MIKTTQGTEESSHEWQDRFVEMLPEIERCLRLAFCQLASNAREDAMAESIAHCVLAYARLHEQGRADVCSPSSLAWYSSHQVKCGRPAVGRLNCKEPLSRYGRIRNDIRCDREAHWIETLVLDNRASVVDQVAAKLDVRAWFATLTMRMKEIAKDLAFGGTTSEVARKHKLSVGRVSQLRRTLEHSWLAFQQEIPASSVQ